MTQPNLPPRKVADVSASPVDGQTLAAPTPSIINRQAVGGSDASLSFGGVSPDEAQCSPSGISPTNVPLSPDQEA